MQFGLFPVGACLCCPRRLLKPEILSTEAVCKCMNSLGCYAVQMHPFLFEMVSFGNVDTLWSKLYEKEVAFMFCSDILGFTWCHLVFSFRQDFSIFWMLARIRHNLTRWRAPFLCLASHVKKKWAEKRMICLPNSNTTSNMKVREYRKRKKRFKLKYVNFFQNQLSAAVIICLLHTIVMTCIQY